MTFKQVCLGCFLLSLYSNEMADPKDYTMLSNFFVTVSNQLLRPILTENLNMKRTAAKFVPCLQNDDKKQNRLSEFKPCEIRPKRTQNFLPQVKDWGERWVYCYDPDSTMPRKYTSWIAGDTGQGQETRVPELLPAVRKTLVPVYKFQRRIIWKGKYKAVNKVTSFVIVKAFSYKMMHNRVALKEYSNLR